MRILKVSAVLGFLACLLGATGCVSQNEYQKLQVQNNAQAKRIADLSSELQTAQAKLAQLETQLAELQARGGVTSTALEEKLKVLENAIQEKDALIKQLQQQILGGSPLPVELSTMLEDFAKKYDLVTFDSSRGIVKFKSDLLFEKGSDEVKAEAAEAVKGLCTILNSEQGKSFDVIVAGHTDDIPISKGETRLKHPTNWHLSAHRAISVLDVMTKNSVESVRLSARGFGEFRPVEENKPNKAGNPVNRRVEIYIVPKGM